MNLRHLEFFAAVTRRGTFSGASAEVGVSQPALSQAMATLESDLGAALFERTPAGVRLTAAGRDFLPHAVAALDALESARAAVGRVDRLEGGLLAIACPSSLGIDPLPRLIAAFRQQFPDVGVRVHALPEHHVDEQSLFDIGADVVVTFAEFTDEDLHVVPLSPVELFAVLPGPERTDVSLQKVLSHGLITTPPETAPHRFVSSRLGRDAMEEATAVEVEHPEAVLPLVRSRAGAAVLPAGHAHLVAGMPGLERRRLDPAAALDVVAAVPHSGRSAAARQFLRLCGQLG